MNDSGFNRRGFIKTCVTTLGSVVANPDLLAREAHTLKRYERVLLTTPDGQALRSDSIKPNQAYVFNYPYVTTPCFLINLARTIAPHQPVDKSGQPQYRWQGGVGPQQSVVSFSAICTHKLSYPTQTSSFLNYRPDEISYHGKDKQPTHRKHMIYCCSERSVYDPAKGAQNLTGPAPLPLAAVVLEYDPETDSYFATGTLGKEMFDAFFERFGFRIELENPGKAIREKARNTVAALPADHYSSQQILC